MTFKFLIKQGFNDKLRNNLIIKITVIDFLFNHEQKLSTCKNKNKNQRFKITYILTKCLNIL